MPENEEEGSQIQAKPEKPKVDLKKLKRENKQKFINYYMRGSYFGKSSSSVFYQLSAQLNRNDKNLLWWWIVGLAYL